MILERQQTEEVVRRLRGALRPRAIYLFGSQATGAATEDESDVDLCIVVHDDDEDVYQKSVRAYRVLRDLDFPKDLIVRHESSFKERATWLNSIEREVATSGKLIYRR